MLVLVAASPSCRLSSSRQARDRHIIARLHREAMKSSNHRLQNTSMYDWVH
jgi:RNase P protein component